MKSLFTILLIAFCMIVVSCSDKRERNYQYFPDMYESVPYDTYGAYDIFQDEQEAKIPEEGSISRGFTPYEYDDDPDGYALAKAELKNEVPYTEENLAKGKELYAIYCATCHGDNGKGKGYLVEREKILGVPSYDDQGRAITEGSVYHVMWHGINTMGSYASQMDSEELWLVDHYVMKLKAELEGQEPREFESESE
ncbi:cytochrome c [Psychroflexus gondwanensis]|jgi:mono/diheme cytochrome c family protein|uniref:Cytochrome c oxidase subunit III n=1 Tax=Psychroflexus gondwanensis ACAM 44 TaxID=1189619 RepID=N1WVL5_9FLAO|nr:cytochrome c [Psychroflexus gondwanensis]EMY81252.1 cytochrome c oxidase subunit III [Psychroflexus gondwanensis ACAM 44]TXE18167.1 cytochrome c [Psychroflexus gondwanensis]